MRFEAAGMLGAAVMFGAAMRVRVVVGKYRGAGLEKGGKESSTLTKTAVTCGRTSLDWLCCSRSRSG